nr:DUF2274 domain-containing protein [Pseudomonas chlororaphis]
MKLSFACPASLKADLDRYAALHAQAYGETVDVAMLILHRLEAFIAGDRGQEREHSQGRAAGTNGHQAVTSPSQNPHRL